MPARLVKSALFAKNTGHMPAFTAEVLDTPM
ncbi:hypothetical protein CBM2587_B20080 [Cupriavidus taiwanensis]|uniref:Uncharacterized protein n=1 Tax=Cupriavidus taiwanensis TaxID=164546 RepID=A0A375C1Z1_9BURK|nr:hypothetical protein CBM2587_B20080 [Cupriavidus taiwanensis]